MYKEIVTKAVIGKGRKSFRNRYEAITPDKIDTVLGCWVIKWTGKKNKHPAVGIHKKSKTEGI